MIANEGFICKYTNVSLFGNVKTVQTFTVFGWKDSLVVDGLLDERHDVVDVLGGGEAGLLALVIHPDVLPA